MWVKISFDQADVLFKHECIGVVLSHIAQNRRTSAAQVRNAFGFGVKAAWSMLNDLANAGLVLKDQYEYKPTQAVANGYVLLNVYDARVDKLLRFKAARLILLNFALKNTSIREIAKATKVPYPTLVRTKKTLTQLGIISGTEVKTDLLLLPKDPLDAIPREEHRRIMRYFLDSVKTFDKDVDEPIILFGEASSGAPTLNLNIAVLLRPADGPGRMHHVLCNVLRSAENATAHFGASISLVSIVEDAWLMQKLKLVFPPNRTIDETYAGICINGHLPSENDFFRLWQASHPIPQEKVQEWLSKRRLFKLADGTYVFSRKALSELRRKPVQVVEVLVPVEEKRVPLLTIQL